MKNFINKPCPFCGETEVEIQRSTPDREGIPTNIICSNCGASGPQVYVADVEDFKLALKEWNNRI